MNAAGGANDVPRTSVEERLRKAMEEPPPYEDRYLAFVDILGWKEVVKASESDPNSLSLASFAAELIKVAKEGAGSLNEGMKDLPDHPFDLDIRVSHFSDSFVFSLPNERVSEIISTLLQNVCIGLLEKEHYTRGGIVLGKVRHSQDGSVLFGPAMNDAYDIERNVAKYPRIVVGASAQRLFDLPGALRTDFDGLKHLNVLGRGTPERIPWLESLRDKARRNGTTSKDLGLVAKHQWFRAYVEEVLQEGRAKSPNGTDVHDALARLRVAAMRLPGTSQVTFRPGASTHEIDEFEAQMGARLPVDFRTLLQASEAIEDENTINRYSIGGFAQLSLLFKEEHPRALATDPSSKLVPIAEVALCTFLVASGDGSVWRWDRLMETPELEKVAETISAFLERVADDWERISQGDKEWPYLCKRWS